MHVSRYISVYKFIHFDSVRKKAGGARIGGREKQTPSEHAIPHSSKQFDSGGNP
jgi:hypothetical protein